MTIFGPFKSLNRSNYEIMYVCYLYISIKCIVILKGSKLIKSTDFVKENKHKIGYITNCWLVVAAVGGVLWIFAPRTVL